jgi:hypothetical protein
MASGGSLKTTFKEFATKAGGAEATSKDITRWCTDAGVFKGSKTCTSNNLDIAFSAVKTKGKPCITADQMTALVKNIAKKYGADHKLDEAAAEAKLTEMLANCKKEAHGTTKQSKTGGVDKMTDASKYTGAHKERFDADGKGKGKDGRADTVENTGYVGNYKGEGTHGKK